MSKIILHSTDYVLVNEEDEMVRFVKSKEVIVFGSPEEANSDKYYNEKVVPTNQLSEKNKEILIKQIQKQNES